MSTQDHNKTLVLLYSAIGGFYTLGLVASPWIIAQNFRRPGKAPQAVVIFGIVFLLAFLFISAAILMYRRRPMGRTLALIGTPFSLFGFWPVAIYTWWFMHSKGARSLYGISLDRSDGPS
jgi:hypothetical protein